MLPFGPFVCTENTPDVSSVETTMMPELLPVSYCTLPTMKAPEASLGATSTSPLDGVPRTTVAEIVKDAITPPSETGIVLSPAVIG